MHPLIPAILQSQVIKKKFTSTFIAPSQLHPHLTINSLSDLSFFPLKKPSEALYQQSFPTGPAVLENFLWLPNTESKGLQTKAHKQRMVFTFLNGWKKLKEKLHFMTCENCETNFSVHKSSFIETLIYLWIVYGWFCIPAAELSSYKRVGNLKYLQASPLW